MTDPEAASAFIAGILALLGVLAVHGLLMLARHRQRGTDRDRHAFDEAYEYRPRPAYTRGAYPLTPMPPESPAQRQLRDWQERLDARSNHA